MKYTFHWYTYTNDSIHKSGTWNEELGYGLIDAGAAVALAAKDLETTYVRDVVIDYPENYNNTYVEVENVTIQSNGYVESEFVKSAILRSSVVVEEGGYLYVYPW